MMRSLPLLALALALTACEFADRFEPEPEPCPDDDVTILGGCSPGGGGPGPSGPPPIDGSRFGDGFPCGRSVCPTAAGGTDMLTGPFGLIGGSPDDIAVEVTSPFAHSGSIRAVNGWPGFLVRAPAFDADGEITIATESGEPARADLVSLSVALVRLEPVDDLYRLEQPGQFGVLASDPRVLVGLWDRQDPAPRSGERLIDISLEAGPQSAEIEQVAWDTFAAPDRAGTFRLDVVADSFAAQAFEIEVFDSIDRIEAVELPNVGFGRAEVCFYARAGDVEVVVPFDDISVEGTTGGISGGGRNCRYFDYDPAGDERVAVTARALGQQATHVIRDGPPAE